MNEPLKKYRPANGTEGMIFQQRYCNHCKRDWDEGGCEIYTRAFLFGLEDGDYPEEWVYNVNGNPTCTAFDHVDNPGEPAYRCPETPDMFDGGSKKHSEK